MAHRKEKAEAEKSIPEMADEVTREEMRRPHRVSAEAEAGSEVQIETLPADQQEPARKEWEKVLRPFKRREPWL